MHLTHVMLLPICLHYRTHYRTLQCTPRDDSRALRVRQPLSWTDHHVIITKDLEERLADPDHLQTLKMNSMCA